jgi:ubiquinone biosynthesis protein
LIEEGYNVKKISDKLITFFIESLLKYGVFHADCHPGNISVKDNKIIFYDFGLV